MHKVILAGIVVAALAAASASAGEEPRPQSAENSQPPLICRTVNETGSRLKVRKVCMTSEQWADQRKQDRMLIERSQVNACTPGASC